MREGVVFVPLGGVGPKLLLGKVAYGITNHGLVGGEQHGVIRSEMNV
jgi:hypothetical protein